MANNQADQRAEHSGQIKWIILSCLLLILSASLTVQCWRKTEMLKNETVVKQTESEIMYQRLSKLLSWPKTAPLIKLEEVELFKRQQSFLAVAEDGDWLWLNADQAALYRPSLDKIINIGSWYINDAILPPDNAWRIEIRNGSRQSGAASALAKTWSGNDNLRIVTIDNAATTTYSHSLVIFKDKPVEDFWSSTFPAVATNTLPVGESSSTADVLIILGNDYAQKPN